MPITKKGEVILGLGMDGFYSLSLEEIVHLGVSGETGSGKSVFLRQLITQVILTDHRAVIIGIDFKGGVEFSFLSRFGNFICIDDFKKAEAVLDIILNEYQKRLEIVRQNDCDSVYDLKNKGVYISPIIIIIDEAAEFFGNKKANRVYESVEKLARLGRFVGIHLIVCTQRASSDVINTQVRSMLTTRVIFKVSQKEDSIMFIGTGDATKLRRIPGRFYLKSQDMELKELQAPYISKDEVKQILSKVNTYSDNVLIKLLRHAVWENDIWNSTRIRRSESVSAVK